MLSNKELGRAGEEIAREYLENLGYQILEKNYRCKHGEIDLIAKKDNVVIFIEVKTRKSTSYGDPEESINSLKIKKIRSSANHFICFKNLYDFDISFEVISIKLHSGKYFIKHIKNAF